MHSGPTIIVTWWLFFCKGRLSPQNISWLPVWPRPFIPDCSIWLGDQISKGGSKFLPIENDWGHHALAHFQCRRQFSWPHGLVFTLTNTINCETSCRQARAFPNYVQLIKLGTGGLQSSNRSISRTTDRSRMTQSSIASVITLGLKACLIGTFESFYFFFHK